MSNPTFRPAWWLPGPHLQTLGARLLRARLKPHARRERVELADGDFLDLDWVKTRDGQTVDEGAPLVVVLHGLEGSASSGYACQLYRELIHQGLQPVGMNFRGCSGEPNRLPRAYHSGETGDLAHVVGLLRERFPARPVGAVGVSLGGNVLLKYLGENGRGGETGSRSGSHLTDEEGTEGKEGKKTVGRRGCREPVTAGLEGKEGKETTDRRVRREPGSAGSGGQGVAGRRDRRDSATAGGDARRGVAIDAAAAISVPFDLSAGADFIERGFSKTYRLFLVRKLQRKVRAKHQLMRGEVDLDGALNARSFREFDQAVIVPIHGFDDAEDYYRKSSSAQFLDAITVPTLLIHSLDDPFLPSDRVPQQIEQTNPNVRAAFTRRGGHVGFVTGAPWSPAFWGERRVAQFLAKRLRGAI